MVYTHLSDDEVSYAELKKNVAEILGFSEVSSEDLQNELLGPDVIKKYRKLAIENSQIDGFFILIIGFTQCSFRDFESYLRILVGLD